MLSTLSAQPTTAQRIATQAHAHQKDLAGQPHIAHVKRVVGHLLRFWPDASEDEVSAAWLHDVLEDTHWTTHSLRAEGVSSEVIWIVVELTRPKGKAYLSWIRDLAGWGSMSAVKVKLADNEDNSDPERVAMIADGQQLLEKRYRPARVMLEQRLVPVVGRRRVRSVG